MRFFVSIVVGLALALPALGVWVEPSVPASGGAGAELILGAVDQTKAGSLELSGGATAIGRNASAGEQLWAIRGVGDPISTGTVSAGVYGKAATTAAPACSGGGCIQPIQVGVYGAAGANSSTNVGVYADGGGFANAWAGYFLGGMTGFGGALSLSGAAGNLIATSGLTVTTDASPAALVATSVTTGKAAVYGNITVGPNPSGGSSGGEGFGLQGYIDPAVPNCAAANCSGLLGADTDSYVLRPGRFAGYFVGNVHVTDRLYLQGHLTTQPVSLTDTAFYSVPSLQGTESGALLGLAVQTGTANDATGGVTSTGQYLIVTDYLGVDGQVARLQPSTLQPATAGDVVTLANPAQQVTYDGQDVWVRSNDTLRRLSGQTLTETGNWTFTTTSAHTLDDAQPTFVGTSFQAKHTVWIGTRRLSDSTSWLGTVIDNGTSSNFTLGLPAGSVGCRAARYAVAVYGTTWISNTSPCGNFTTTLTRFLAGFSGNSVYPLGVNGHAAGIAFDGTNLWVSTQTNENPAGSPLNANVRLLRVDPNNPAVGLNLVLPNTTGYTAGHVVFDGTNLWVSASVFGQNGFGYDGKLFRIPVAAPAVFEIDRSATAVGASPIRDLYFDGSELYLYGYNAGAAPRINYYLEKRSR